MSQNKKATTKNGRGLGKMLESIADQSIRYQDNSTEATKFPGAYKTGTEVLGLMRNNIDWVLAEIYDIREAKFFKEQVDKSQNGEEDKELFDTVPV